MPDLIIHGHFYQPPREDPWIEEIEGEPSAAPFMNWNERIHSQCYRPNAHSRILGEFGRVTDIVNNYRHLSFNFGPTLLSWMNEFDPETLAALVSADQESQTRNYGHGNAIAQAYNHIIMPLADEHDKETQIIWGLADFRFRFGREPESMWMPETAVDLDTIERLVHHKMKYVILSPYQAWEVEGSDGRMNRVSDGRFDTSRPYWVESGKSRIAVFFYHPTLSADISFNHLLRSSNVFADRLLSTCGNAPMLNIATDGEIYGHHEPFGDMGLAHTLNRHFAGEEGKAKGSFRITNYGAFLERNPPTLKATLRAGGTSWSCSHGVERWRSDCGCKINHASGWKQAWRGPLRSALDHLRDALRKTFETRGAKYFKDPWHARNDYIDVILHEYAPEAKKKFAARHFKKSEDRTLQWRLLESQRNAMLMFTSCGWFFDDVSGIEPRQLMLYAARAIDALGDLAPHGIEEKFVRNLREAKSNDPAIGDGEKIYRSIAHPRTTAKLRVLNQAILSNYAGIKPHGRGRYATSFSGEAFWDSQDETDEAAARLGRGTARVRDVRTEVEKRYAWVGKFSETPETLVFDIGDSFRWPGGDPRQKTWDEIRPVVAARKGTVVLGVKDLFKSEARLMAAEELRKADRDLELFFGHAVAALDAPLELAATIKIAPDPLYSQMLTLMADFLWAAHVRAGRRDEARRLKHRMEKLGVLISKQSISTATSAAIDRLAGPLSKSGCFSKEFDHFMDALRTAQEDDVIVDAKYAQEVVYAILKSEGVAMIGEILSRGNRETYRQLLGIFEAAERLYIDIGEERKLIEPFERKFAHDPSYWP